MERTPYVLVVDDDVDILGALGAMLEDAGYLVKTTEKADYAEALPDGNGGVPDLIILDILLSGKDGRIICHKLKTQPTTRHIPIVMISAHLDAERSVAEVGADAFLAKPFDIDALLDIVATLLATSRS